MILRRRSPEETCLVKYMSEPGQPVKKSTLGNLYQLSVQTKNTGQLFLVKRKWDTAFIELLPAD